MFHSYKVFILY